MPHTTRTRDFQFELPDDWIDRTMVAWSARPTPGHAVAPNILIAYDALPEGDDLPAYVNRQLKELMTKARKFQLDLRQDILLSHKPAIELVFHWDMGNGLLKQRQIYSMLSDRRVVTWVNTAAADEFEQHEPLFTSMRNSFSWNETA